MKHQNGEIEIKGHGPGRWGGSRRSKVFNPPNDPSVKEAVDSFLEKP